MESLQRIGDFVVNEYKKNGIKWLTRAKYTSMVASPFLAAFGAVKADREIQKRKKERNVEKLPLVETAGIIVKNEAGAAISMVGGIVASVKVDEKYQQTIDALTTAVVLGEDKLREIKETEKEVVGKEKSEEIQKKAEEKRKEHVDTRNMARDETRGVLPCLETKTGQILPPNTKAFFQTAFVEVQQRSLQDNVFLGEFIELCGGLWFMQVSDYDGQREVCKVGSDYLWPENHNTMYKIDIRDGKDMFGLPIYVIEYPENCGLVSKYELPWAVD